MKKTATCNISVSESSGCTMEAHQEVSDLPVDIGTKLLTTSLENHNWYTDMGKQYTAAISCNISQIQYLFQKLQLQDTNIYKYISIHVIDIYMIQKTMQSILCHTISLKCFSEFTMNIYIYISIQILHY